MVSIKLRGEPSSDHAVPFAAIYSVWELSQQVIWSISTQHPCVRLIYL